MKRILFLFYVLVLAGGLWVYAQLGQQSLLNHEKPFSELLEEYPAAEYWIKVDWMISEWRAINAHPRGRSRCYRSILIRVGQDLFGSTTLMQTRGRSSKRQKQQAKFQRLQKLEAKLAYTA